jgi:hypothetical protein
MLKGHHYKYQIKGLGILPGIPKQCLDNLMAIIRRKHYISFLLETIKANHDKYYVQIFMIISLMQGERLLVKNKVKQDSGDIGLTKKNYKDS